MGQSNGTVGTGDQNKWLDTGKIYEKIPDGIPFKKTDPAIAATWQDSACWIAGTPVTWDNNITEAKATTAMVREFEMLASKDSNEKVIEYHPLITFFNKVMAEVMSEGYLDCLKDLEDKDNAVKLAAYLAKTFPIPSETLEHNSQN
jgi:hypothetical protein